MALTLVTCCYILTSCSQKQEHADAVSNISVEQAKKLISDNAGLIVVDVRTPEETAEGKLDNAIEINFFDDDFEAQVGELSKEEDYLIYCRSGRRSAKAADKMINLGFKSVYNMEGGYNSWSESE